MKNFALEHFRRPPAPLNCAQSVLYAYHQATGNTAIPLSDMKTFGSGRAPDGLCGAIHAACILAPDKAESLSASFTQTVGSVSCTEIRAAKKHSCEFCVSHSAELLEQQLGLPAR